jgi:hypothetical protein
MEVAVTENESLVIPLGALDEHNKLKEDSGICERTS